MTMTILLPIHILAYGYTLGSTTFHSFVASTRAIETLPRREFGAFQSATLPIQFATQSIAPLFIGLTAPYSIPTMGLALLGVSSLGGLLNYFWIMPVCNQIKTKRYAIVDSAYNGDDEKAKASGDLDEMNKSFGKYHGLSMVSNMFSIVALAAYGFVLSGKLRIIP